MELTRAARTILGVTALAWAIPFAQAGDRLGDDKAKARAGSAKFIQLDARADASRDGRRDGKEFPGD